MYWTRLSFYYLMSYLGFGGIALLAAPEPAIKLLGSTGTYPAATLQMIGGFMVALSIIIINIVRYRVEVLYPITLLARVVLLATFLWIFFDTHDPLFLVLSGVVGLGMI